MQAFSRHNINAARIVAIDFYTFYKHLWQTVTSTYWASLYETAQRSIAQPPLDPTAVLPKCSSVRL